MKLQFLGTSAGTPTKMRNVTALALSYDQRGDWYLVDCGEATQHQLLRSSFSLAKLSKIFITHLHGDHIFGLPGLLTSRSMAGSTKFPVTIYGPKGLKEYVETSLRLSASHITYPLEIIEFTKASEIFAHKGETVTTVKLSHDVPSFAYIFKEADHPGKFDIDKAQALGVPAGPLLGKLNAGQSITLPDGTKIDGTDFVSPPRPGRCVVVGGDNDSPDLLASYLKQAHLFIHEATLTVDVKESLSFQSRHSTAESVGLAAEASGLRNLILTHISPRFRLEGMETGRAISEIEDEVRRHYTGKVHIASDFDIFHLDRRGELTAETIL